MAKFDAGEVQVALQDCPPGLFLFNGSLCLKTEYRGMETVGPTNVPGDLLRWKVGRFSEVFVAASGEVFWGGAKTKEDREMLKVTPLTPQQVCVDLARAIMGLRDA